MTSPPLPPDAGDEPPGRRGEPEAPQTPSGSAPVTGPRRTAGGSAEPPAPREQPERSPTNDGDQDESVASPTPPTGESADAEPLHTGTGATEAAAQPESIPPRGPQSLLAAVKLMYVGAGLQALSIAYTFAARVQLRDQIAAQQPSLTSGEVEHALNFHLMSVAVIDVLAIAMWIWMAQVNRAGLEWARIVATVLAPLNIAFTLFSLSQAVGAMIVVRLVIIALSAAILFLLYQPDSTVYYRAVAKRARR